MHVTLTLALMHDRFLAEPLTDALPPQSAAELHHWCRSTALFTKMLTETLTPSQRDALWLAAVGLGAATIGACHARSVEEAWPLCPPSAGDLDWVRMSNGKKEVWRIADPTRPDSCLRPLAQLLDGDVVTLDLYMPPDAAAAELDAALPRALVDLFRRRHPRLMADVDGPYRGALLVIAYLMPYECTRDNIVRFFLFFSHMSPAFHELLQEKDPYALIILAYWYAKVGRLDWFMTRRAILEGQAICVYLERYYAGLPGLDDVLAYPKLACVPASRAGSR